MKRKAPDRGSEPLFDLPLDPEPNPEHPRVRAAAQPELPLEQTDEFSSEPPRPNSTSADPAPGESSALAPVRTPFRRRLLAGLLDLAVHAGMLAVAILGSAWLGVPPNRLSLVPLVLFLGGFSFIYHVLPLVFWGRTPGMAAQDLTARGVEGRPLTIAQAVRRWLGALLNLSCLGLPFAFLGERSIADRLSRSTVHF